MMIDTNMRTIGLYPPFAQLMLHGKVETRWVKKGKKPPFPLGAYLIYATKRSYTYYEVVSISGKNITEWILNTLKYPWRQDAGYMICVGELIEVYPMKPEDEGTTFVKYEESETHTRWCLRFKDVQPVVPYIWSHGKQGIGFLPESEVLNIKIMNTLK